MKSLKQTEATTALTLDSTKQKTSVKQCKFILFDVIKSIGNDNDYINISKQMTSTTIIKIIIIITTSPTT